MRHLSLKISAFVFATTLWVFVSLSLEYQKVLPFPIHLNNLPEKMSLEQQPPDTIELKVTGSGWHLLGVNTQDYPIELDLKNANLGDTTLELNLESLANQNLIPDVKVISIVKPKSFKLKLTPRLTRKAPVELKFEAIPKAGYVVVNQIIPVPQEVEIIGGRRSLARTLTIPTVQTQITELSKDTTIKVLLDNPTPNSLSFSSPYIEVKLKVQKLGQREFSSLPVSLVPSIKRAEFSLKPANAKIIIRGGEEDLKKIKPNDIYIFIDYNRFEIEAKNALAPSFRMPESVLSHSIYPETFELIEKENP